MDRLLYASALLLLSNLATANEYEPVHARLAPIKVSEHTYYVQGASGVASAENEGFNSNAGFVITRDGVVVIDALGTPSLGKALIEAIGTVTRQPIKRVILTHYHADHFYGLQAFQDSGAEIWAHQGGREYLQSEGAERLAQRRRDLLPWVGEKTRLVPADRWLSADTSFTLGGLTFDLIHMGPAHAPDDLVIVVREDQVIFSGDISFSPVAYLLSAMPTANAGLRLWTGCCSCSQRSWCRVTAKCPLSPLRIWRLPRII